MLTKPGREHDELSTSPCFRAILGMLRRAKHQALKLRMSQWDFAEELSMLHDLGASNGDIRWLLQMGFVDHAEEVSSSGDNTRQFRGVGRLFLSNRTCFILTDRGESVLDAISTDSEHVSDLIADRQVEALTSMSAFPRWDKDRRVLRLGEALIKRFRRPAPNQELVLEVFEEEGWPYRIDDPLPRKAERNPQQCLHDTIIHLNRNQISQLLRFHGDGNGCGICWEMKVTASSSNHH